MYTWIKVLNIQKVNHREYLIAFKLGAKSSFQARKFAYLSNGTSIHMHMNLKYYFPFAAIDL